MKSTALKLNALRQTILTDIKAERLTLPEGLSQVIEQGNLTSIPLLKTFLEEKMNIPHMILK